MLHGLKFDASESPRLVHRLDKDCSGVLLLARTRPAAVRLFDVFKGGSSLATKDLRALLTSDGQFVRKRYLALCVGVPPQSQGVISAPLVAERQAAGTDSAGGDDDGPQRMQLARSGSVGAVSAISAYKVLQSNEHLSLLQLSPLTGRRHQLRVHCGEVLKAPIVVRCEVGKRLNLSSRRVMTSSKRDCRHRLPRRATLRCRSSDQGGTCADLVESRASVARRCVGSRAQTARRRASALACGERALPPPVLRGSAMDLCLCAAAEAL